MTIKIEKNIPLPQIRTGPDSKYPLEKMEVGDSFAIPEKEQRGCRHAITVFHRSNSGKSIRFTMRRYDGAYRVWRIS